MRLLIVRHPETTANAEGRFLGAMDAPLSPSGCEQAEHLQSAIVEWGPDALVSSPAGRALRVARGAAARSDVPLVVDVRLAEIGLGAVEGLTHGEAEARGLMMDGACESPGQSPFEEGETWDAFLGRVRFAVDDAVSRGERVALVTHAGPLRGMFVELLGLPWEAGWRFALPPATIAEIEVPAVEDVPDPVEGPYGTGMLRRLGPV